MTRTDASTGVIVEWSATRIAEAIRDGEVSAREVLEAHIARIEEVNPRLNAVVVPLFETARSEADDIDRMRARGEPLGPLAGVPLTIKECFYVAGTPSTVGIESLAHKTIAHDGPLVARLRRAGAVILGKTNVPQLMLMHETDNPVYGRTQNPWDLRRAPGGSSGGEAAIIAARGSPAGLGSDMGGSIRQPAHSCGLFGLKPTLGRLTNCGCRVLPSAIESIGVAAGPIARSASDLDLLMRALIDNDAPEIDETPLPWRDPANVRVNGLRAGMWTCDGYFEASPAVRRAVEEAAEALQTVGVTVEPFDPPDVSHATALYLGILTADGGKDARRALGRSKRDARIARLERIAWLPKRVQSAIGATLTAVGQRGLGKILSATGPVSARRLWRLAEKRRQYRAKFVLAMDERGLDFLICPPHALPALTHGAFEYLAGAGSYSMLANLLSVPAGVAPVTRVGPREQSDRKASHDLAERAALAVEADSEGLPVGVQILARAWREDIVLAVLSALENQLPPLGQPTWRE